MRWGRPHANKLALKEKPTCLNQTVTVHSKQREGNNIQISLLQKMCSMSFLPFFSVLFSGIILVVLNIYMLKHCPFI